MKRSIKYALKGKAAVGSCMSGDMKTKKKNAIFGRYPCCDMVNNAMRLIINGCPNSAIEELLQAIWKADGYVHDDIADKVNAIHKQIWEIDRQA